MPATPFAAKLSSRHKKMTPEQDAERRKAKASHPQGRPQPSKNAGAPSQVTKNTPQPQPAPPPVAGGQPPQNGPIMGPDGQPLPGQVWGPYVDNVLPPGYGQQPAPPPAPAPPAPPQFDQNPIQPINKNQAPQPGPQPPSFPGQMPSLPGPPQMGPPGFGGRPGGGFGGRLGGGFPGMGAKPGKGQMGQLQPGNPSGPYDGRF